MTPEQTKEAIRIMQAYVDGKEVEGKYPYGWDRINQPNWDWVKSQYRIKPTPVLRPWTKDEVPLGAWLRPKKSSWRSLILAVDSAGKLIAMHATFSREDALERYEHSLDGGKTWKPCGVMEEVQ